MKHQPKYQSREELVAMLQEIARKVEVGDSLEGFIEYALPDEGDDPGGYRVRARFRVGNVRGQGGMRIVGKLR